MTIVLTAGVEEAVKVGSTVPTAPRCAPSLVDSVGHRRPLPARGRMGMEEIKGITGLRAETRIRVKPMVMVPKVAKPDEDVVLVRTGMVRRAAIRLVLVRVEVMELNAMVRRAAIRLVQVRVEVMELNATRGYAGHAIPRIMWPKIAPMAHSSSNDGPYPWY